MKAKELLKLNKAQIEHPGQLRATWSFSGQTVREEKHVRKQ
jgi:hypothetical protein